MLRKRFGTLMCTIYFVSLCYLPRPPSSFETSKANQAAIIASPSSHHPLHIFSTNWLRLQTTPRPPRHYHLSHRILSMPSSQMLRLVSRVNAPSCRCSPALISRRSLPAVSAVGIFRIATNQFSSTALRKSEHSEETFEEFTSRYVE